MNANVYRFKPLEHSREIGGVWVACEWAACMDALVYDVDGTRYRMNPGTDAEGTVAQVVDNYLDRNPHGTAHVPDVEALVMAALPGNDD